MAKRKLQDLLFLDIETAGQWEHFSQMPERFQALWNHKSKLLNPEADPAIWYREKGAIYAEFGRVVCISLGWLEKKDDTNSWEWKVSSISGESEFEILDDFLKLLDSRPRINNTVLCAHNGKEFDFPYLCRRMTIHALEIPALLYYPGRKPWEVPHLDTMEWWKFGDRKSYTSLETLAAVLDLPAPKQDMNGAMVHQAFYAGESERIQQYCENDVRTTAEVFLHLINRPVLTQEKAIFSN
jgi:3'-5' exonuclease